MLFGHKNKLQIDLGDLQTEKDRLASFLQSNLNASVTTEKNKLVLDAENLSITELHKEVTKYIHRHNLSRAYWVSIQDKTVKINKFRYNKKKEKNEKSRPSQAITQSWGL